MAEQEDFSSLPLPDRFAHKVWKVRKEGYEEAKRQFEISPDEDAPVFRPFLQDPSLWKGVVADSNVAAQQEGLAAYCAFLKFSGYQACNRTRSVTAGPIIEKGLPQTRPAAKASSLEALLLFIELDSPGPVIEELIAALSHKTPKVIAGALGALTAIYHNYGVKIVETKPILKSLPKVFGHADKNVRAEAQNLTVELYRWLKEALKATFWNDLKPVQQQDLEKMFEKVKQEPSPKQERFTRTQQAAMAEASANPGAGDDGMAEGEGEEPEDDGDVDVFDLVEPVDIIAMAPKDLHQNLASSKWKDRKDALDDLYKVVNVPRIKEGNFDELCGDLGRCMKDANVLVVTVAANTICAMATGLRRGFAKYRTVVMPPMMERLKEKKTAVSTALGQGLDAVFLSTSLSECLEDILGFLKHKNPQVKQETFKFLVRCLRATRDVPSKGEVKSIAEAGTKLLTDSSEVTRSGGAEVLGTLMKIMGERAMNVYLDGLDEIRKTKIKEFFETAEVKAKDRPKPIMGPPKTMATPAKKPTGKKPMGAKKAAPAAAPAAASEPPASPAPAKKAVPKIGGRGLSTPGSALKMRPKLSGPGGAASPQRRVVSPPLEEVAAVPPPPKFGIGGGGRGLASRPIGKPSAPVQEQPVAQFPTGLAAIERAELEEVRAENGRLSKLIDDLRAERLKLSSEVHELQNQNAQLIEDHTRDVLSIKAKETQLVRARGDAETAEQSVQKQQREIERLKRELSRAMRAGATSPPVTIPDMGLNMGISDNSGIYQDDGHRVNGTPRSSLHMGSRFESARPRSFISSSPSEEKENTEAAQLEPRELLSAAMVLQHRQSHQKIGSEQRR
ncbi:spindle pole body component alp14 [Arthroderma uncinatum]|uniref:spindle pole body component alp14 n=1 Tax=Arthroderma uncinatum TaxID=74035 RepID=UPI00144AB447|nr:spindle pole body component alp14 [Arthroderma uncinatum]KAF3490539.1 spindle pole body component alp14 [Arthroderma uncinatum]